MTRNFEGAEIMKLKLKLFVYVLTDEALKHWAGTGESEWKAFVSAHGRRATYTRFAEAPNIPAEGVPVVVSAAVSLTNLGVGGWELLGDGWLVPVLDVSAAQHRNEPSTIDEEYLEISPRVVGRSVSGAARGHPGEARVREEVTQAARGAKVICLVALATVAGRAASRQRRCAAW